MKTLAKPFAHRFAGMLALVLALGAGMLIPAISPEAHKAGSKSGTALKTAKGQASYYGARFHGRKTASGRKFNMNALVAAHPQWPFGTIVRVTNLRNNRTVNLEVIDRGPARSAQRKGVIIDVSVKAAQTLDFVKQGKTNVSLDVLEWGKGRR